MHQYQELFASLSADEDVCAPSNYLYNSSQLDTKRYTRFLEPFQLLAV